MRLGIFMHLGLNVIRGSRLKSPDKSSMAKLSLHDIALQNALSTSIEERKINILLKQNDDALGHMCQ